MRGDTVDTSQVRLILYSVVASINSVTCPLTVLLNVFVIIAIKKDQDQHEDINEVWELNSYR